MGKSRLKENKMYAVISTSGKQYKVEQGNVISVDRMDVKAGDEITLENVLLIGDGEKVSVGRPNIAGAKVVAEVLENNRGPKIIVFKKRSKKGYKKTIGHRQDLTELKIKEIKMQ